jgi:hypothetical protein
MLVWEDLKANDCCQILQCVQQERFLFPVREVRYVFPFYMRFLFVDTGVIGHQL